MDSDRQVILNNWVKIPLQIETVLNGLSDNDLEQMVDALGFSVRATVHHLVEANIVAASMIIAAMGKSGTTYDWAWLYPNAEWCERLGYSSLPIEPAIATLRGLVEHISNIVGSQEDGLLREISLFDSPGAESYALNVGQIIKNEVDHAAEHLADVRKAIHG